MSQPAEVVLITGASMGIGEALSSEFLARGAIVVMTSREVSRVEVARQRVIGALPGAADRAVASALDVRQPEQVRQAIDMVRSRFGRIDVWVNNAGYGMVDTLETMSLEQMRQVFETNLFAAVDCMQAIIPVMKQQHSGTIINISSVVGHISIPFMSAYSATKHALNAVGTAARVELAGSGVHVMTVCPGRVQTKFADNVVRGASGEQFANGLRRGIDAQRAARAIVRGYRRRSREVVVPWTDKILIALAHFAPSLVEFGMGRMIGKTSRQ
jgi:short-subunit dehydrogenase